MTRTFYYARDYSAKVESCARSALCARKGVPRISRDPLCSRITGHLKY